MDRLTLNAAERTVLGKKVKNLRKQEIIPAHVFGDKINTEHISVLLQDFLPILHKAGETGLIDLRIGEDKIRPVMIRDTQHDPVKGELLHIDFYQVNLKEKVKVPVPLVLEGEDPEVVHTGEAVILQTVNEIEVEALPTDLVENIVVNIAPLKQIDDAISVGQLSYDRDKLVVLTDPEEIVVKLAPAITEEMQKLMEEQAAEQAAAAEAIAAEEGAEAPAEGEEAVIAEEGVEAEVGEAAEKNSSEEPRENQ